MTKPVLSPLSWQPQMRPEGTKSEAQWSWVCMRFRGKLCRFAHFGSSCLAQTEKFPAVS
eukprot:CAMPEP_0204061384 /NCGR_PEP_ID=MMETSP0360-20130528/142001_1 /ASSEMBLY_ACC=CAM_ASM_000342 /TAXON_ID=268821 /ORGANISM="Scrippsiella Hangoei, Strain SHTV-5" /LENGTH=58 /DNA_ID=CAMNT_0051009129 /DNA_START=41 /DNA_END=220 /DNA_ORIENTATION=+